jgi:hypothetical protein
MHTRREILICNIRTTRGFGVIMEEKPIAAFVLTLIGGILVLITGAALAMLGVAVALFTFGAGLLLGVFALFGIVIIVGSIMMYSQPSSAKTWGIIVLILGILSLFGVITALGGILALIGGILAIVWKPSAPASAPPLPP